MWKTWTWSRTSNDAAIGNARASATQLSRCRVERQAVELFLDEHLERTLQVVTPARRPA